MGLVKQLFYASPRYEDRFDYTTWRDEGQDGARGGKPIPDQNDTFTAVLSSWMAQNTIDGQRVIGSNGTHATLSGCFLSIKEGRRWEGPNAKIEVVPYVRLIRLTMAPVRGTLPELTDMIRGAGYQEVQDSDSRAKVAFFEGQAELADRLGFKRENLYPITAK